MPIAVLALGLAVPFVPNSKNPEAERPDLLGALLSIAGLGLLLWAIIDAPVHGWASPTVIGAGFGGLAVLAGFALWEMHAPQPMLRLSFFRNRRFSVSALSVSMVMFGLFGALFVLTQFLQFDLGYTALQTGIRVLPGGGLDHHRRPLRQRPRPLPGRTPGGRPGPAAHRRGSLADLSATVLTTYGGIVLGMVLLGVGAALVIPSVTSGVMGSLPAEHTGIGAATNGAFLQVGGALGVAVLGSQLLTRYQSQMLTSLAPYHVPASIQTTIMGSIGGALGVAGREGGMIGQVLAGWARSAFVNGMDLALLTGALVAAVAALLALIALPGASRRLGRSARGWSLRPRPVVTGGRTTS